MRDEDKTREQLVDELSELRQRIIELETAKTERERDESALRRSEKAYRLLFEQSVDGVVIIANGSIVRANRAFCNLHGLPVDRAVGMNPLDLIHPEDRNVGIQRMEAIRSGEPVSQSHIYRALREDGSVFWGEVQSRRIEWEGEPALQSIVRDVTERKRAEEEIRKLDRFLDVTDKANVWLNVLDEKGKVVIWNKAAEEISGYSRQEVIGHGKIWQWLYPHEAYRHKIFADVMAIIEGSDEQRDAETIIRRKDGQTRVISWNSRGLAYDRGKPTGSIALGRDITEQKLAEEALRESEERYRQAVENSPNPIFSVDRAGIIQTWNPACEQLFQYSSQEIVGQTYHKLLWTSQDYPAVEAILDQVWHGQSVSNQDMSYRSEDGTQRFTVSRLYPLMDHEGCVKGCVFANTDITERRRAEHQIKERQMYLEGVLAATPDAIVTLNPQHLIVEWNPGAERLFGYSPQEAIGQNLDHLITGAGVHEEAVGLTQVLLSGEEVSPLETIRYRKDGSPIDVIVAGSPIFVEDELIGLVALYTDITERKQAEEALWTSEKRFRSIAETASDAIIIFDSHENIFFWNQAARVIFGYPGGETAGKLLSSIMTQEFWRVFRREMKQVIETGESDLLDKPVEVTGFRRDGTEFPLELSLATWTTRGETFFTAIARDITARKQAEEALKQRAAQMALLNDISEKIAAELELDSLLDRAVRLVQEGFDYQHVAFLTVDHERGEVAMKASVGDFAHLLPPGHRLELGQGMVGWVGIHGETLLANDVSAEPRYVNPRPDVIRTRSELSVPVQIGEEIVGVLDVQSMERDAFDDNDVMLIETLADQLAVAIDNARLYEAARQELAERKRAQEEAQRRAAQTALMYDVGQRVSGKLELEELFSEIVTAVRDAFDYHNVMLMLLDEATQRLTLQSIAGGYAEIFHHGLSLAVGQGMIGYAAATGETQISGDVSKNPHYVRQPEERDTRSELAVPIKSGQRVIGVLDLQSNEFDAFDETDVAAIETLNTQIAAAIENASLFKEAHSRAERLTVVNRIAKAASATLHVDDLMETVYREITPVFQADAFFIALYDEEREELDFRYEIDEGVRQPGGRVPLGVGLTSVVVSQRKPLVIRELEQPQAHLPPAVFYGSMKDPASWLGAPMLVGERVIGVISVQAYRSHAWDKEDEQLLLTIADQVAVALENARLYEETQDALNTTEEQARNLVLLNEMGEQLSRAASLGDILDIAATKTRQIFESDRASVSLLNDEGDCFEIFALEGEEAAYPVGTQVPVEGQPMGIAVREKRVVVMSDVQSERMGDMHSYMIAPLVAGQRTIGALNIGSNRPQAYTSRDEGLLLQTASLLSSAIENRRLFEQVRSRADELAVLNELGQALTARLNVDQVLEEAHRQAARLVDTTIFFVDLYDPEKDELTLVLYAQRGKVEKPYTTEPAGQGISGHIVRNQTPVLIRENVLEWLEEKEVERLPIGEGRVPLCWLGVPLLVGDQVLGVMAVQSVATPRLYDEHDRDLLTAIASQVAIAVQNARLYEKAQRRAAQAALIYQVGRRVSGKLELKALSSEIVTALYDAFDYYSAALLLLDEKSECLTLQSITGRLPCDFSEEPRIAIGEGMVGYAAATGETQVSGDVSQNTHYIRKAGEQTKSELAAPIKSGRKVIGVLDLQSDEFDAFDDSDVAVIETLSAQIATAIENAQLYATTQRQSERLAQTLEMSELLHHGLMLDQVLEQIAQGVIELGFKVAVINIYRPEEDLVRVQAVAGCNESERQALMNATYRWSDFETLMQERFQVSRSYLIRHGELDWEKDFQAFMLPADIEDRGPGYWRPQDALMVPMWGTSGQPVGILSVDEPVDGLVPDLNTIQTLEAFANQAAVAIENAWLFEAEQHRRQEAEALRQASLVLGSTLDVTQVLDQLLEQIRRVIPYDSANVILIEQGLGRVTRRRGDERFGTAEAAAALRLQVEEMPHLHRMLTTRRPHIVPDTESDPDWVLLETSSWVRAWAGVPLTVWDEVIGFVSLNSETPGAYTPEQTELLSAFAVHVAIAIENAQLVRGLENQVAARTAEIRAEQEKVETILRSVGDAIVMTDHERRIRYVNEAFTILTGYSSEEALGQPVDTLIGEGMSEQAQQDLLFAWTNGEPWQGEVTHKRKDGRVYDAALTISPVRDAQGHVVGHVSSHRDISQRKELDRARNRFMTNVSHELRTPVANMKLYARLLQMGRRPERTAHHLQVLNEQTDRLSALIQDILEMTALDSGRAVEEWKPIPLPTVVGNTTTRYQSHAEASDLTLTASPLPSDLSTVKGDPTRLSQALGELVENALTFTPAGGQVTIQVTPVKEEGQHWVTIAVRDTGPGIPPEEQERVFDRFYRGSLAESGHVPGTGLGLSIVREIMRAHGGRVTAESEMGQGSTFTLWLRSEV